MAVETDAIVVGMGVAGEGVTGALLDAGLDVVGIESNLVGGECPYWGCIPSKMMIRAANLIAETRRVPGMAGESSVTPDWAPVAQRIREEATDTWDDTVAVERFTDAGGRFYRGEATILGRDRVEVDGETIVAKRALVIATGSEPAIPPIDGLADTPFWTNREAIAAETLPDSLLVLGGGAIGLELAQVYRRFGVEVTVVEGADRILPPEEPESSELLREVLEGEGMAIHVGSRVTSVSHDDGFVVRTEAGDELRAERLLVATGRRPRFSAEVASALGIEADGDLVDDRMRVTDGVWAVGDVTDHGAFTHVGTYQADIAAADILGRDGAAADYRALPRVTFTDPEVGSVGLSEQAARDQGITVRTGIAQVPPTSRGWIHKAGNEGLIKLVSDADSGLLVGATSAGPTGGEVLGALAVAVHGRVPVSALSQMIYAYPTFHRGIQDAVRDLTTED